MAVNKLDPKVIFASEAPAQDIPAVFTNRTVGWGETRKNGGRPTIKQMNAEQQSTDLKILWLNENAVTPYDSSIDYPTDTVTIKDGIFKIFDGSVWEVFLDKTDIGLGDVDDTSDLNKPVSTATQTALDLKADKNYVDTSLPHNNLIDRNSSGAHETAAIVNNSGETQQQINDRGGATWYTKSGGYDLNNRVNLANGDIVRSTIPNNTNDPNVDMTGWISDSSVLLAKDFIKYDGVTNNFEEYQKLLDLAATTGITLDINTDILLRCPDDKSYQEPKVLNPQKLHIICRGFIHIDHKSMALRIERTPEVETAITGQAVVAYPTGQTGNYVTRLTVSNITGFKAGRVVLCHSSDLYEIDSVNLGTTDVQGSEKAQLVEVMQVDIANKYIYLREILIENLVTFPKVALLRESDIDLNLKVRAYGDITDQTLAVPDQVRDAVVEDFGVASKIRLEMPYSWGGFIGRFSCWKCDHKTTGTKASRNLPAKGSYPYGHNDSGATRFGRSVFFGGGVRHAYTNTMRNSVVSGELRKKGRQRDNTVHGLCLNSFSASWDTHPGAANTHFYNCQSLYPSSDFNAVTAGQTGTQTGFQDRGEGTTFTNPYFEGNGSMFVLSSKVYNYGDYETKIICPVSRKNSAYSLAGLTTAWMRLLSLDPLNLDRQTISILGGSISNQEKLFDFYNITTGEPSAQNISIFMGGGLRLYNVNKIETGNSATRTGNELIIDGVTRSYYSSVNMISERIYAYGNANLKVYNYTLDLQGAADASAAIVASGAGSANITVGNIVSNKTSVAFVDVATVSGNTPVLNYTKQRALRGYKVYDAPSIAAGGSVTTTVTVAGVVIAGVAASTVIPTFSADLQGIQLSAWISAGNTVTVRLTNPTTATIDLSSGSLLISVERWT